jgi:hypothetical protein
MLPPLPEGDFSLAALLFNVCVAALPAALRSALPGMRRWTETGAGSVSWIGKMPPIDEIAD